MAKIDLDSMSIEELVALRENATAKLAEKVATRQAELQTELERLSEYGKPAKKSASAAPAAKVKKSDTKKSDVASQPQSDAPSEPIAEAA